MKKIINLVICFFVAMSIVVPSYNTLAEEDNLSNHREYRSYEFVGESIVETISFEYHEDKVFINRTIYPDNSYEIIINDVNGTRKTYGNTDYNMFKGITEYYEIYGVAPSIPVTRGTEITGSNFEHVFVADTGEQTFYRSSFDLGAGAATAYGIIGTVIKLPYNAGVALAGLVLTFYSANNAYKTVIKSTTYEVRFSYDKVYYTHCYHQTIKAYDDQLHYINTKYDYYQSIGG